MASEVVLSYSWKDRERREFLALREHLSLLGRRPWCDQEPRDETLWWKEVLARIRASDIFVAAVSSAYVLSPACRAELQYAFDCRRHVLPVAIESLADYELLESLRAVQVVDYSTCTAGVESASMCTARLAQMLGLIEASPQEDLPTPPPPDPPLPASFGASLGRFRTLEHLSEADQVAMLEEAKRLVSPDPAEREILARHLDALIQRTDVHWPIHLELVALADRLRPAEPGSTVSGAGPEGALSPAAQATSGRLESRTFWAPGTNLVAVVDGLTRFFDHLGMQSTVTREPDGGYLVQSDSIKPQTKLTGAGAALSTRLSPRGDNVVVTVSGKQWADKAMSLTGGLAATFATSGLALPLVVPSMVGAYRQSTLPKKTFEYLEQAFRHI